jgi:hypothetical protein
MHLARMLAALLALTTLVALPTAAPAWTRTPATTFATLPAGAAHPEGITVDHAGNVYVTTFDVTKPAGSPGEIFVYSHAGRLLRRVSVAGSSNLLLDLAFHPTTGALLVIDFGGKQVLSVNPFTGASTSS